MIINEAKANVGEFNGPFFMLGSFFGIINYEFLIVLVSETIINRHENNRGGAPAV